MKYILTILSILIIAATCEVQPPQDCTTYDTIPVYHHYYDTTYIEIKYDQIDSYVRNWDYIGVEYIGNWDKSFKVNVFSDNENDTIRIRFWGQRIRLNTRKASNLNAYKVFLDKRFIKSVPVKSDILIKNIITFEIDSIQPLQPKNHNHIIELVPDGGYFVFNGYEVYFWTNPNL